MVQCRGRSSNAESDERDVFSTFDLFAALGTQFLSNACITSVTPVALLSAEAHKATSPLATSGGIAAATSIGMAISMACTYNRSAGWLDGKTPYVLFALLLIAGSGCYVVAEAIGASLHVLISTRIAMSLGFGAIYCTKRRAAVDRDPRQREYLFLLLELASSSGMASGPMLTGAMLLVLPTAWQSATLLVPALVIMVATGVFLVGLLAMPIDVPLHPASASDRALDPASGPTGGSVSSEEDGTSQVGLVAMPPGPTKPPAPEVDPHEIRPPVWASAVVVASCLSFGVGRNFLKFGFESALVVVYDRQLGFSSGVAGIIAGSCALAGLALVVCWKVRGQSRLGLKSTTLLCASEVLAFLSALLMLASSERVLGRIVHVAATRTNVLLGLTLLSSVAFYPAMYLGAALGNSRPIVYAQPGHRLLSRDAIIAQQDLVQTTLGKALGMIYCRKALGEGDHVHLAGLGSLFVVIMAAQAVVIGLGWSPETTLRRCRRSTPAATELEEREQGPLLSGTHDASRNASGLNLALENYTGEPTAPGDKPS
jgi:MFS family permease